MNKALYIDNVNKVTAFRELRNKLKTFRTYKSKKPFKHLKTPGDFLNAVRQCEEAFQSKKCTAEKTALLWFLEKLARKARVFDNASFLLQNRSIERFKPILHVGWGMDCLSETGFDFPGFAKVIETSADRKYKLLAMEPIGVIFIAAKQPLQSAFIGINTPTFPDKEGLNSFFENIGEEDTLMISHGYGRGSYFKVFSLPSALKEALNCPNFFNPNYAIRGVAFAYTMVNNSHLDKVFHTARTLVCNNVGREECGYFSKGISSALSFIEWNSPGLLETLEENDIIANAKELLKNYHSAGGVYKL
jgi:hypothetical protein